MTTATPGGTLSHKVVFPEKRAIIVTVKLNVRTAKEKRQRSQKKAAAPAERGRVEFHVCYKNEEWVKILS